MPQAGAPTNWATSYSSHRPESLPQVPGQGGLRGFHLYTIVWGWCSNLPHLCHNFLLSFNPIIKPSDILRRSWASGWPTPMPRNSAINTVVFRPSLEWSENYWLYQSTDYANHLLEKQVVRYLGLQGFWLGIRLWIAWWQMWFTIV